MSMFSAFENQVSIGVSNGDIEEFHWKKRSFAAQSKCLKWSDLAEKILTFRLWLPSFPHSEGLNRSFSTEVRCLLKDPLSIYKNSTNRQRSKMHSSFGGPYTQINLTSYRTGRVVVLPGSQEHLGLADGRVSKTWRIRDQGLPESVGFYRGAMRPLYPLTPFCQYGKPSRY
jgi:hypothetical protein